jgi:hypothetical protein
MERKRAENPDRLAAEPQLLYFTTVPTITKTTREWTWHETLNLACLRFEASPAPAKPGKEFTSSSSACLLD